MENFIDENEAYMNNLCNMIRKFIKQEKYSICEKLIYDALGKYPDAPQPHNLLGILLEKSGDHKRAMKHFRAAAVLDPTYLPARQNLDGYGTFLTYTDGAYDESDCKEINIWKMEK